MGWYVAITNYETIGPVTSHSAENKGEHTMTEQYAQTTAEKANAAAEKLGIEARYEAVEA